MPSIGVVVPCKNEAGTLFACLTALRDQQPRIGRIVVVDNGSTDGSREIAARAADRVIVLPGASISRLRNRGAAELGDVDVVGFVDADVVVAPQWLPTGLEALADGADLIGSRSLADDQAPWVAARWAAVERHRAHPDSLLWSQHLLVRRSVFASLSGFDETMRTGEDADLSARARALGHDVRLVPEMTAVHHGFPGTLRGFLRRELWHTSTSGWLPRMAPNSRRLVTAVAAWAAAGATATIASAVVRRPEPMVTWCLGSVVVTVLLGRIAGGSLRHSLTDGVLLGLWSGVRVGRLAGELGPARGEAVAR